jgi:hypothetical protein
MNPVPTVDDVIRLLASVGLTPDPDADLDLALASAIQAVNRATGLSFGPPVTETRAYHGRGDFYLPIDACTDVTAVNLVGPFWGGEPDWVGSPVPVEIWETAPANTPTKNALVYLWGRWPSGYANVQVTATFGAPMPPDLYEATLYLAADSLVGTCGAAGSAFLAGGVSEYKEGEISVKYGGSGGSGGSSGGGGAVGTWKQRVDHALRAYVDYAL